MNLPAEDNPFLGHRAERTYPEFESIVRTQIRAMIRASAYGRLRLMLPMVATLEEIRWARKVVREEQQRCSNEGVGFDNAMLLGGNDRSAGGRLLPGSVTS